MYIQTQSTNERAGKSVIRRTWWASWQDRAERTNEWTGCGQSDKRNIEVQTYRCGTSFRRASGDFALAFMIKVDADIFRRNYIYLANGRRSFQIQSQRCDNLNEWCKCTAHCTVLGRGQDFLSFPTADLTIFQWRAIALWQMGVTGWLNNPLPTNGPPTGWSNPPIQLTLWAGVVQSVLHSGSCQMV